MKFKKIAAILSSAFVCAAAIVPVGAEETEETTEAVSVVVEEAESEDALWTYSVLKDNTTNEEYAVLNTYTGSEAEVVIPDEVDGYTVSELGTYTFYENPSIKKITISESLKNIGDFPFFACSSLEGFEVDEDNEIYSTVDGILMADDEQLLVCYPPAKSETEYTIPDGTVALSAGAFATCKNLSKVTFPDTLERMGLYCFAECTSLNNVTIPESVTELSEFNFTGCTSLTDITLPDTMHTIGSGAFSFCTAFDSIEFPTHLMEIGQGAFVSTGFTEIEIPATVQEIGYSAFGYVTDEQGQLVAMDSFIIKGLTGSMAQSYCGENEHVEFVSIDDTVETEGSGDTADTSVSYLVGDADDIPEEEKEIKPGIIAAICIAGVVILAGIIILIKKLRGSSANDKKDETEKNNNSDDKQTETEESDTE